MIDDQTTMLQRCLDRLHAGDEAARNELLQCAQRRLLKLTRKMLKDFPRLRRWEESHDILHGSLSSSIKSLALSPDGQILAAITQTGEVKLWDRKTWRMRQPADTGLGPVRALAFAADGRTLIAGTDPTAVPSSAGAWIPRSGSGTCPPGKSWPCWKDTPVQYMHSPFPRTAPSWPAAARASRASARCSCGGRRRGVSCTANDG